MHIEAKPLGFFYIRQALRLFSHGEAHQLVGEQVDRRTRQLFAQALGYPLPPQIGDYGLDRAAMADASAQPYLLFLHGTTWASKHWPEADWRALAERMAAQGWAIRLPWGNESERERAQRIVAGIDNAAVLPKLNLAGVAKVIAGATACVAVDTGLGHLAAALDVPPGPVAPPGRNCFSIPRVSLMISPR